MAVYDVAPHGSEPLVSEPLVSGSLLGSAPPDAPQTWRNESMCRQHPTKWWFGGHGDTTLAKAICADCAVRQPCLEFALSRPDLLGIWAGTTPTERTVLRRERREGVVAPTEIAPRPPQSQNAEPMLIDLVAESERDATRVPDPEPARSARRGPRRGWREPVLGDHAELLTPAEAARKLGVTPNTVTRWSRAGKLAAIQTMGGHRRFRRTDVERLLREANASATNQY